jgi:hypothetical protein
MSWAIRADGGHLGFQITPSYTTFLQNTKRSLVISNEIILEMKKKMSLPIGGRVSHHGFQ